MYDIELVTDPRLRAAAALPPGPEQWATVRALDVATLSYHDQLAVLELTERCKAALDADQQPVYAALSHGNPDRDGDCVEFVCDEIASAIKYSPGTCGSRLLVGQALVERFPETLAQLARGQITYWYRRALADLTVCLSAENAAQVAKRVLDRAPRLHLGEYRQAVRRAVAAVDPEGAIDRTARGVAERAVWLCPADDTTASLGASGLPVTDATAAYQHLDALARATADGDDRTLEQRRADVFLALLRGELPDTAPGEQAPVAASVEVLVSAETLQGGDAPGELAGYGPIPAPLARQLANAAGSRWRRLVSDPVTGWLQACGERTYKPGAWLQIYTDPIEPVPGREPQYRPSVRLDRYVRARDRRCAFPGCTRRARRADLDHIIPWPRGDTHPTNLHPLCRHHHRLKTHAKQWHLANNTDGTWTWQTPAGRRHTKAPFDYRDLR